MEKEKPKFLSGKSTGKLEKERWEANYSRPKNQLLKAGLWGTFITIKPSQ